jgi:hypothetical protein
VALEVGELVTTMKVDRDGLGPGLAAGRAQVKRAADDIADDVEDGLGKSGERGSRSMIGAIAGGLPALGPAVVPLLVAIGSTAGLALGGALAAAVILAVPIALAGGVLAAGIMAAAKDPAVGAAFKPLGEQAKTALNKFAEPFKGPLIRAAQTFGAALAQATPYLVQMGQAVAPIIDQLAPALAKMAVAALPGILSAVKAGVPLIIGLVGMLPNLGRWISVIISGIASAVPWALRFGGAVLSIAGWIGSKLIPPIRELAGTWLKETRSGLSSVQGAFKANEPQIRTFVHWISQAVSWVAAHLVPVLKSQLVTNLRVGAATFRFIITAISAFVTAVQKIIGATKTTVSAVRTGIADMRSWFSSLPGQIVSALASLPGRMRSAGMNIIRSLADGMASQARAAVDKVRNIVSDIAGLIPGSPVKHGPLRSLNNGRAGRLIMSMLAGGVDDEAHRFQGAVARALGGPTAVRSTVGANRAALGAQRGAQRAAVLLRFEGGSDPWVQALRKSVRVVGQGSAQDGLGQNSVSVAAMG